MGIIWLLLMSHGLATREHLPAWVIISCYTAISVGTLFGGWRIIRTMGQKLTKLKPASGVDHAHDYRRDPGRRLGAEPVAGTVAPGHQPRLCMDPDDSRRGPDGRSGLLARAFADPERSLNLVAASHYCDAISGSVRGCMLSDAILS